ncbi:leucine-rich repeat domain-containing protein [Fimbriiglobus ruber]
MAKSPNLARLTRLSLRENRIGYEGAIALVASRDLPRRLILGGNRS